MKILLNNRNKITLIIMSLVFFAGCTEVIDIDLNSTNSKIVIEGSLISQNNINVEDNIVSVQISKTMDYFYAEDVPKISNAVVEISDSKGNTKILEEKSPGFYKTNVSGLNNIYGEAYSLNIKIENKTYIAKSVLTKPLIIDSVSYFVREVNGTNQDIVTLYFLDNSKEDDYAQVKVYLNKEQIILDQFALYTDQYLNGEYIDLEIQLPSDTTTVNGKKYKKGDIIDVELITFNKDTYQYYNILDNLVNVNVEEAVATGIESPDNPPTNLSNNALGFFGVYSVSKKSLIIK